MEEYLLVLTREDFRKNRDKKKILMSKFFCGYDYDIEKNGDILVEENMNYNVMDEVNHIRNELVPVLSDELNRVHGMDLSREFWEKILCFWWLPDLLYRLYLKYFRIRYVMDRFNPKENLLLLLLKHDEFEVMKDPTDFVDNSMEEKYDLQLWSRIVEKIKMHYSNLEIVYIDYEVDESKTNTRGFSESVMPSAHAGRLKRVLKRFWSMKSWLNLREWGLFVAYAKRMYLEYTNEPLDAKCYMYEVGFSGECFDRIVTESRAKARPIPNEIISRTYRRIDVQRDSEKRKKLASSIIGRLTSCSPEEKDIINIILEEMPLSYLELFQAIRAQYSCFLNRNTKYFLSRHGCFLNTPFLFYIAESHDRFGTELRGIQHGGGYQSYKLYIGDLHISDKFYVWGTDDMNPKFVSSAPYKLAWYGKDRLDEWEKENRAGQICYIEDSGLAYMRYREPVLFSYEMIGEVLDFLESLSDGVLSRLKLRMYPQEYGWDLKGVYSARLKKLSRKPLEEFYTRGEFMEEMLKSDIIVCNMMFTVWLEALALHKPVMMFFKESYVNPLLESEKPHIDMLRRAGIVHDSGESAGRLLSEICDDIDGWWNEPGRQEAVRTVQKRYWNDFGDPDEWWVNEICSLVKK